MSYHGYSSFEYVSLINSGLLVFFRSIFDQWVCFRVPKFFGKCQVSDPRMFIRGQIHLGLATNLL